MRLQNILDKLERVQDKGGGKFQACCPAHEDNKASLSVKEADGKVLLYCHAGCDYKAILDALGLPDDIERKEFIPRIDDALSGFKAIESPNAIVTTKSHLIDRTPEKKVAKRKLDYQNPIEVYDYRDHEGNLVYQAVRLQVIGDPSDNKNFLQRKPKAGGGWDYKLGETKRIVYRFPEVLEAESNLLLIAEGEKDVNNLFSLGFVATCNVGGAGKWHADYSVPLAKRDIVIFQDNDEAGVKHSEQVAASFGGLANSIRIVTFDDLPPKSDVSDWLDLGKSADDLKQLIDTSEPWTRKAGSKPEIQYQSDESKTNNEIIKALGKLGADDESSKVYSRGGVLVGLCEIEDPDIPKGTFKIQLLSEAVLRERITQSCSLFNEVEKEGKLVSKPLRPPMTTVKQIRERGNYRRMIKPLAGVIQAPTIRKDGSIIQEEGYDEATGLIYKPLIKFDVVPDEPTIDQVQDAILELEQVITDFPFVSDSDKSAWLAMVLTLIARQCVDGCCPLFAVTANTRGAGKSLLADAASLIAYGRPAARRPFTDSDNELRKAITAIAIEGVPCVLFDNLSSKLRGASLDAALTSQTWQDRILGASKSTPEVPLKTVWLATGNNIAFGTDVARRVIPIRLDTPLENPEERSGFQHGDLLKYVKSNRSRLAVAALTILRGFFAAGKPKQANGQFGSFEEWAKIIRGAIVWTGSSDPLETREHAKKSDESADLLEVLTEGLLEAESKPESHDGFTAKEIEQMVSERIDFDGGKLRYPTLAEAIGIGCGSRVTTRAIGNLLRQYKDRTVNNTRITAKKGHANRTFWRVEKLNSVTVVNMVNQNPSLRVTNSEIPKAYIESGRTHKKSNQSHHSNQIENLTCSECNSEMVAADETVNGWVNFDCLNCGKVKPKLIEEVAK